MFGFAIFLFVFVIGIIKKLLYLCNVFCVSHILMMFGRSLDADDNGMMYCRQPVLRVNLFQA